jgi:hypothetical protein
VMATALELLDHRPEHEDVGRIGEVDPHLHGPGHASLVSAC